MGYNFTGVEFPIFLLILAKVWLCRIQTQLISTNHVQERWLREKKLIASQFFNKQSILALKY